MKNLILIFLLSSFKLSAQVNLIFDKRFIESEDKWVAFQMNDDSSYNYGFIYIDEVAGLTLDGAGTFKFNKDNSLTITKLANTDVKYRLQPNDVKVAFIPAIMYKELKVEPIPDWLKFYKTDTASVKRLYKWGFMYNGWDLCEKALPYLLRAREIDPKYEGLNVELAFSYNCLKEFDKAEEILEEEIKLNPTNAYVNKEYIYTITKTKYIEKATAQYFKSLETLNDKTYNAENCYNILQYYYNKNDVKNFNIWYKEFEKWPNKIRQAIESADKMKTEMNK